MIVASACDLRGLTRSQLHGSGAADAGVVEEAAPLPAAPDVRSDPPDPAITPDASIPPPDLPMAPPEGIVVTGFVHGVCDNRQVMVGGAGAHTCSTAGKGSYTLIIRDIPPGTRVEIGAKVEGYVPHPETKVILLERSGTQQDFHLRPASGSCDTVPDAGPCICTPPVCRPS